MKKSLIFALTLILILAQSVFVYAGNIAEVTQTGNGHLATVYQEGDENEAYVEQDLYSGRGTTSGAVADIEQVGIENYASQYQTGRNGTYASVIQEGNNNQSLQDQDIEGTTGTRQSILTQEGDGNTTDNFQTSSTWVESLLKQVGNNNLIMLYQLGESSSDITQTGDENAVYLYQNPGSFFLTQTGDRNEVFGINEGDDADPMGVAEIPPFAEQYGSSFIGTQDGDDNQVNLYQSGNNVGLVSQVGYSNVIGLFQTGINL